MALKIIFSENVDYGLPDHLVKDSCIQVLHRLQSKPTHSLVHRTGQKLVWDTFVELLTTGNYEGMRNQVEFHNIDGIINEP